MNKNFYCPTVRYVVYEKQKGFEFPKYVSYLSGNNIVWTNCFYDSSNFDKDELNELIKLHPHIEFDYEKDHERMGLSVKAGKIIYKDFDKFNESNIS